jgi:hypothetical protein
MAVGNVYQTFSRYAANASSYTLSNHQVPAGANMMVVVAGLFLRTVETDFTISSLTFNGTGATSAVEVTTSSSSRWYRAGIWVLPLGNVGSTVTADVVATASTTIAGAVLCAITLEDANQGLPIVIWDTTVPAALTLGASSKVAPWALYAACAHNNNYGWTATGDVSPTGVFDLPTVADGTTEIAAAGFEYTWPGLDVVDTTVTMARTGTPPAIAAVAAKFWTAPGGALPPIRRRRTYIRM